MAQEIANITGEVAAPHSSLLEAQAAAKHWKKAYAYNTYTAPPQAAYCSGTFVSQSRRTAYRL